MITETKFSFTIKDLIYIITIVLSIAGTYFTLKSDVDNLKAKIKDHNLELIEYRLNKLSDQLEKIYEAVK